MKKKPKPDSQLVINYRRAYLALSNHGTQEERDEYLKTFTAGDQSRAFMLGALVGAVMTMACAMWKYIA